MEKENSTIEYSSNSMSRMFDSWRGLPFYYVVFLALIGLSVPIGLFLILNYQTVTTGDPMYRADGLWLMGLLVIIFLVVLGANKIAEKRVVINSELIKVYYWISHRKNYQENVADCIGYFSYMDHDWWRGSAVGNASLRFYEVLVLKFKDGKTLVIKGKNDKQNLALGGFKKILEQAKIKSFVLPDVYSKKQNLFRRKELVDKIFEDNGITNFIK